MVTVVDHAAATMHPVSANIVIKNIIAVRLVNIIIGGRTSGPANPAPLNPPLSRRSGDERGRSERRKGWFVRGRNLGVRSQRRGTKLEEGSDWTEEA